MPKENSQHPLSLLLTASWGMRTFLGCAPNPGYHHPLVQPSPVQSLAGHRPTQKSQLEMVPTKYALLKATSDAKTLQKYAQCQAAVTGLGSSGPHGEG